jgi:hypothetical protein
MKKVEQSCWWGAEVGEGMTNHGRANRKLAGAKWEMWEIRTLMLFKHTSKNSSFKSLLCQSLERHIWDRTSAGKPQQVLTSGICLPRSRRSTCELCRLLHPLLPAPSGSSSSGNTADFHTQGTELGLCSYHHLIWDTSMGQRHQVISLKKEWLRSWWWKTTLENNLHH